MKKNILILALITVTALYSCANNAVTDETSTDLESVCTTIEAPITEDSVFTDTSQVSAETTETDVPAVIDTSPASTDTNVSYDEYINGIIENAIGGEHGGDELYPIHIPSMGMISFRGGTFRDKMDALNESIDKYEYGTREGNRYSSSRVPLWYHLVHDLNLTREDVEQYYKDIGVNLNNIPAEIIDALFLEDENEAKKILKSPFAFYADGSVYNIYDLAEMGTGKTKQLNIDEEEMAVTLSNIDKYLSKMEEDSRIEYDSYIRKFVDSCAEQINIK